MASERGRLNRLFTYTSGPAKELIQPCIYLGDNVCFTKAIELLDKEYGNRFKIARAYIKQLREWPNVKGSESEAWKKFHRFLLNCKTFKETGNLEELDRPDVISVIITKLDATFQDRWTAIAEKTERVHDREVNFNDLLEFIEVQSGQVSHPLFSRQALKNFKANTVRASVCCSLCKDTKDHSTNSCPILESLGIDERYKKVFQEQLCFACLTPISDDHNGKTCSRKLTCNICWSDHPTILHNTDTSDTTTDTGETITDTGETITETSDAQPSEETAPSAKTCAASDGAGQTTMCVVLVHICHEKAPSRGKMCYALLDQDCTGCFASSSLLSEIAPAAQGNATVNIHTLNSSIETSTESFTGITVRPSHIHAQQYGNNELKLPTTYAMDKMPFGREDMATSDTVKRWEHLKEIARFLPTYKADIPFGLMIGGNCPQALEPHQCIASKNNGPFAYRTMLGWVVVGPASSAVGLGNSKKCMYTQVRLRLQDVATGEPSNHYLLPSNSLRDTTISKQLKAMYSTEFDEQFAENKALSVEDKRFLQILDEGVRKVDGHYEAPVPFRSSNVFLPENKEYVLRRLFSHKYRMQKDPSYKSEYSAGMAKLIRERAERCSTSSEDAGKWFIPHHAVRLKGKALRIVFDCSATYEGYSLNNELLQGPDLVNQLVGVLARFRREPVAYSADLEACFHQIHIPPSQRRYFCFLWWRDGDITQPIEEHQMCVHLFGAVSSPSVANYIVKHIGRDNAVEFGNDVQKIMEQDVDVLCR